MNNRTSKSIIISYLSILFSIVTGLLYTPWLIRSLGKSDYAIYTISTSIMAYFTIDFGIGAAVTRFIARYRAEGNEDKINGLLGVTTKLYLLIDLVALSVLVSLSFFLTHIYAGLNTQELEKLKVVYVITGLMIVLCIPTMPINGVFIAFNRVYEVKICDLIQKSSNIALICIAIILGRGLFAVTAINAFTTIAINIFKVLRICTKEKIYPNVRMKDKQITKSLLAFSGWVALAMIADKFFFTIEPTLLGAFSNSTQIALFAVAVSIEGYVLIFADGLNGIFLPQVTKLVVEKKNSEVMDLMIQVGRMQLFIVTMLILGVITQGRDFMCVWFGTDYENAYLVAVIVLLPCWVHLTEGIGIETLYATNSVKYRTFVYIVSAILNVVLTSLLAPKYGAIGAAIGVLVGFIVGYEVLLNLVFVKVLHLDIKKFFSYCHLRMVPTVTITGLVGLLISHFFPVNGRIGLICRCGIWGGIYLLVTWVTYLTREEKTMLLSLIKKKKNNKDSKKD